VNLPERELAIARRLRAFREVLKIPRTAFALSIGVGGERLASYEAGRVALRYHVFRAINQHFRLNPQWLATGEESPQMGAPIDDSSFTNKLRPGARFTEAYDRFLKAICHDRAMQARRDFIVFSNELQRVLEYISGPGADDTEFISRARAKLLELRSVINKEVDFRDAANQGRRRRRKRR
jgi:hypothetical protein